MQDIEELEDYLPDREDNKEWHIQDIEPDFGGRPNSLGTIAKSAEVHFSPHSHESMFAEHVVQLVKIKFVTEELEDHALFESLANEWARDTRFTSSIRDMALHPNYQRIIGFGPRALPWILRRLAETHEQWFWALRFIAGVDAAQGTETVPHGVEAWLRWGAEKGYHTDVSLTSGDL